MLAKLLKTNIVYITEKSGIGGGETSLLNLIESITQNGHSASLLCPPGKLADKTKELRMSVHSLFLPNVHLRCKLIPTFSIKTVYQIYKILKASSADIVHVESLLALYYGGMAARLAGIPCVATYHGYWPTKSKFLQLFIQWFCKDIYPVSRSVAVELSDVKKRSHFKAPVIPLGFHAHYLSKLPSKLEARKQVDLPLDRPVAMQVARFEAIKGQIHLLEALEKYNEKYESATPLIIFVGGVMEPITPDVSAYKLMVEEKASQPKLRSHVKFLGHRTDIPLLMRAADVIVSPSEYESFSMTTIEAMAVGTPVIATASGGPTEILKDRHTGILVPAKDADALAEGIHKVIVNPHEASQLAERAKVEAIRLYSPQVRYEKVMQEYLQILK